MHQPTDNFERIGLQFEADVYALGRRLYPSRPGILDPLATSLSLLGRHAEALDVLDELTGLAPEASRYRYNRACALSQLGRDDDALTELQLAVGWGFDDFDYMLRDPDLKTLHNRPEFEPYRRRARAQRTAATAKSAQA